MNKFLFALTLAAAASLAPAAHAAVTIVDYSFDTAGGTSVGGGSFSYDSSLTGALTFADLASFTLTLGSNTYDLSFVNSGNFSPYYLFGFNADSGTFVSQSVGGFPTILAGIKNSFTEGFFVRNDANYTLVRDYASNAGEIYFDHVSISMSTGAVPEPATWAMLITGFGLVGAALRRRTAVPAA